MGTATFSTAIGAVSPVFWSYLVLGDSGCGFHDGYSSGDMYLGIWWGYVDMKIIFVLIFCLHFNGSIYILTGFELKDRYIHEGTSLILYLLRCRT